ASAAHCREPVAPPLVRRSCAQLAATVLCSMPSAVHGDRGALRPAPDFGYMPQSDLPECLARCLWRSWCDSVAPTALGFKTFYNTVVLEGREELFERS